MLSKHQKYYFSSLRFMFWWLQWFVRLTWSSQIGGKIDPKIDWSLKASLHGHKVVARSRFWAPGTCHSYSVKSVLIVSSSKVVGALAGTRRPTSRSGLQYLALPASASFLCFWSLYHLFDFEILSAAAQFPPISPVPLPFRTSSSSSFFFCLPHPYRPLFS